MRKFIVKSVLLGICAVLLGLVLSETPAVAATPRSEHITLRCTYPHGDWSCKGAMTWARLSSSQVAKISLDKRHKAVVFRKPARSPLHITTSVATYYGTAGDFAVRIHWTGKHRLPLYRIIDGHHVRLHALNMRLHN